MMSNSREHIALLGQLLLNQSKPMKERFRILFTLRSLGGLDAINAISGGFTDPSALLKHECAYCLGQMRDTRAIEILTAVLSDKNQEPIVRHEAAEALGAIGKTDTLELLKQFSSDPIREVAETCQLAIRRIEWTLEGHGADEVLSENPYCSTDPAPPASQTDISVLKDQLVNENNNMFDRYRAMFALRNLGSKESALALAEGLKCKDSALFRHEVAFVLGQMQNPHVIAALTAPLEDETENCMVRHECAEALGAIATDDCVNILNHYLKDTERVVRESCEIALDMSEYETSSQFQYADGLQQIQTLENKDDLILNCAN